MAPDRLGLSGPSPFPHADANAWRPWPTNSVRWRVSVGTVASDQRLRFIAGTTSRRASDYWECTTRAMSRPHRRPFAENRAALAVRLRALTASPPRTEPLQCAGAHPRQPDVLPLSGQCRALLSSKIFMSSRAASRRAPNWMAAGSVGAMSSIFTRTATRFLRRNRF